jgi:multidrug efflux pump subunit AcrA (membrane-fusion protein)
MKRVLIIGSIVVAVAASFAGCEKKQTVNAVPTADPIPSVSISKVTRSSLVDNYEATGTVVAKSTTQVSANLMGRVNSIPVTEGDTVRKGQVLVEIDDREAEARVEKAQAGLREVQASLVEVDNSTAAANAAVKTAEANKELADATYTRYKTLYGRRSVSGQEFDEALSISNVATSELERAKANVQSIISKKAQIAARIEQARADIANSKVYASYSHIVSPVSGVIVKKFVEPGAMASPGVPLLSIEDNAQYRLEATVGESNSKLVHIHDRVNVRIDVLGMDEIVGIVAEILPTTDAASRSYTVKIDLPASAELRTGLYGLVQFPVLQKETIVIPGAAILQRGQLTGVYLVGPNGTVNFRIVTTGKTSEGMIEVLSGLTEGDEVASSDVARLKDGAKVR